jgi:hypothetical protein
MKIYTPVALILLICALVVTPANADFVLRFSTTNNANDSTLAISGNVGDQFTVSVFVVGDGADAAVLINDGLFTFGLEGTYDNNGVISPTATPITLDSAWITHQIGDPNTFSVGQFFLAGQSDLNFNTPVKGNPIRLGQFQFTIGSQGTSSFSFGPDSDGTYTWVDGNVNDIVAPSGGLSITGVPEPGAFGILATVGLASLIRRRKRNLGGH